MTSSEGCVLLPKSPRPSEFYATLILVRATYTVVLGSRCNGLVELSGLLFQTKFTVQLKCPKKLTIRMRNISTVCQM
ncbi:unnamed protein product [Calicophoron daubneyi]|uniref:Uncharacterized protein n=1 Tax=Calicophoron daubneyi TaxID=300641 RepID=A0AAV2SWM0_CALDB